MNIWAMTVWDAIALGLATYSAVLSTRTTWVVVTHGTRLNALETRLARVARTSLQPTRPGEQTAVAVQEPEA